MMEKESFLDRFHSMLHELETHPKIDVLTCKFNSPAAKELIDEIQEKFQLTPKMIEFYSQANGLKIEWERKEKHLPLGGLASGSINLLPIKEVFRDWKGIIYTEEDDLHKPLHPFDCFIDEACAALYLDGSDNPQVYYHYYGEEMSCLDVDFEGYLELLFKSRGFWYWHKTIAKPKYFNPYVPVSIEEKNFREIMPQLFEDFDQSDFQRVE